MLQDKTVSLVFNNKGNITAIKEAINDVELVKLDFSVSNDFVVAHIFLDEIHVLKLQTCMLF